MTRVMPCFRIVVCCSTLLLAVNARAQLEGTLFTEPEEREYLDYLREEFLRNNAADDFDIEEADIPEIPEQVVVEEQAGPIEYSFGGVMARRDGVRIWLNGNLLAPSELPEGFSLVESGRTVSLRITHEGKTFVLLPGQTVDVTVGTVNENLPRPVPIQQQPPAVVEEAAPVTQAAPDEEVASSPADSAVAVTAETPEPVTTADAGELAVDDDPSAGLLREGDDVDRVVGRMTDAEAAVFEAALARRNAAAAQPEASEEADSDAP